jgi:hypothetical protein
MQLLLRVILSALLLIAAGIPPPTGQLKDAAGILVLEDGPGPHTAAA